MSGSVMGGEARPMHPEQWELYEYATEGATELSAHVTAHLLTRCPSCTSLLDDLRRIDETRQARDEFDRIFEGLPGDDTPPAEQEEFLKKFKRTAGQRFANRPARLAADGRAHADRLLAAAAEENGLEKATAIIQELEKEASRGYAYLYFCQMAIDRVPTDPARFLEVAKAVASATRSLPYRQHRGPAQPVSRESVCMEAALLESHALNFLGRSVEAREAAQRARENSLLADDDSFALALCDFYEGAAAAFEGEFRAAWKLLKTALAEFQLYGQLNWAGRAEASLGTLLTRRGLDRSAVLYYDNALSHLHQNLDSTPYSSTLMNRASSLVRLERLDAAKASYAKALRIARSNRLTLSLFTIRYGLATIELKRGNTERALRLFQAIGTDACALNLHDRVMTAELRIAECLGRLGRETEMRAHIDTLRKRLQAPTPGGNPGLLELFACLDKGDLTAGLVAHVAAYVEDLDYGTSVTYQPFRLIAGGR